MCFDQPLGRGAERTEVMTRLHEIRLSYGDSQHHNIQAIMELVVQKWRYEIGGPIQDHSISFESGVTFIYLLCPECAILLDLEDEIEQE